MRFIIKIVISTVMANFLAFSASAAGSCNINGDWYQEGTPWYQFHFVQSGSILLGTSPHLQCEGLIASGSVSESGANFNVSAISKIGFCDYIAEVEAKFIRSCSAMLWKVMQGGEITEATFIRIPIKIVEPNDKELIISNEPSMPLTVKVQQEDPTFLKNKERDIPAYTWNIRITHNIGHDIHIDARIDEYKTDNEIYHPNFESLKEIRADGSIGKVEGGVVGGEVTLSVDYYENIHVERKYTIIKGTNPGQAAIEEVLSDKTLRQIACQESRYKHFDAPREGGIGKLNTQNGSRSGVGIMQLYDPMPTSAQIWNWRENLKAGIELYNMKRNEALQLPKLELLRLNTDREKLGLSVCKYLPPLNNEQLSREILRRYNCGVEHRWEPRDAPNCEGQWVVSPSCAKTNRKGYDKNYVDNVLKCDINH